MLCNHRHKTFHSLGHGSCLIDLHKVALLEALLRLPYGVAIPDLLYAEIWV